MQVAEVDCVGTDFRRARLTNCDLRYASFAGVTFADATLELCDLYRAVFEKGVVFENAVLKGVSLYQASLSVIVGLRRESFQQRNGPALAQDDETRYAELLEQTTQEHPKGEHEPCEPTKTTRPTTCRRQEAAITYRALSGLWSGQGFLADAAWAYVETKRRERKLAWPRYRGRADPLANAEAPGGAVAPADRTPASEDGSGTRGSLRRLARAASDVRSSAGMALRWLGLWFAQVLCLFGEGLWRVLIWIAALAVLPGLVYWVCDGVKLGGTYAGLGDCLLFSAGRLTASTPERLSAATTLVEWIGVAQTFLGIALLGLFGFVLGNKLRGS